MNENVELINYIDVAETVYERVYENNKKRWIRKFEQHL